METVSIAIYKSNEKFYLQIIDSNGEFFYLTITERAANQMSVVMGCQIYEDMEILDTMVTD